MKYDLVVIGGGIIGTGVARDAALRGLQVALFEREDFASGTSSRSTRIIHGGLRYLERLELGLVYEALHERRRLLQNAPHLVEPLPFLFPVYRGKGHSLPVLWAGIGLYDLLNLRRGMPHHRLLPAGHALRLEPSLRPEGLKGGFLYHDAQCAFPERLCVENVIDAAAAGARIENHAPVVAIPVEGGQVRGVVVREQASGKEETVEADLVLNASGPWLDEVERLANPAAKPRLRRTKGIHVVVPRFTQHALIMETEDARRVFFAIPWGRYSLLGTTDTDYDGPSEAVAADEDDVSYLLRELRRVLNVELAERDILYTTAGLRPLRRQLGRSAGAVTRKHAILDHEATEGIRGLVTIVGGKITTFRHIAEDTVDFVFQKLGRPVPPCPTADRPLPGGNIYDWSSFRAVFQREAAASGLPPDVMDHWLRIYGVRSRLLLELVRGDASLSTPLEPGMPYTPAEVELSVREEFCGGLTDFMLRRSMWGLEAGQGYSARHRVAEEIGRRLGWGRRRIAQEAQEYEAVLRRMRSGALPAAMAAPSSHRD